MAMDSIPDILDDIRDGKMVILMDGLKKLRKEDYRTKKRLLTL